MEYKKINVITINLNNAEGLNKTINSVITQTYFEKINYIVIDGGSTDNSFDIIKKNSDKLSYYHSEKDNGLYNAMNIGIDHCVGDYVLFLNSGDEFYDNYAIEKCYDELNEDIVYGNLYVSTKDNNKHFLKKYPNQINLNYFLKDSLPHPSSFIKLELLKNNKYDEKYHIISDWIFFFEQIILNKCTYKHIDIIVSKFYLGGISSNEQLIKKEKINYFKRNSKKPRITIIMPCYNYSKYIKEAIDSIKNSTYKQWHCIIVNDGSIDNSEDIIFKEINNDDRFTYIKQTNKGLSASRNIGIRASNTEYILCLDPDDKISNTYIENAINYLDFHSECTLYYGEAVMFYDDGTEKKWNLPEFKYEKLILGNHIYSSFVYRKIDFNRIGGYDETMKGYEDWEFLIRLLYGNKKVHRTNDIVFYYRRHNESMDTVVKKDIKKYKNYIYNKNKELIINTIKNIKKR